MDDLHNDTEIKEEADNTVATVAGPQENLSVHSTIKAPVQRGGRGRKASPELTRAVHDVRTSEERIKHDIARLNGDKERLIEQVSDLEERLEAAKKEGLLKSTIKRLEALLAEAHDKLNILEGVLPEQSISRDRALMEEVLKKWHEYDRERTNQAKAESVINKTPEDKRAEGDFNRARAAAHALKEEIGTLVKQGELIVENNTPSPFRDEWVSYTREQAKKEAEDFAKKHTQGAENISSPVIEEEVKTEEEPASEIVPEAVLPEVEIPPQEIVEEKINETTPLTLNPDTHPVTISADIHPIVLSEETADEPKVADNDYVAKAEASDAAWEIAQQQIKELYEKTHTAEPKQLETEDQTPLVVPEEIIPEETETETTIEAPTEKEKLDEANIEQPPVETLKEKTEASPETTPKETPEATPVADSQALAHAEKQIRNHINILFEKKGFLGFGSVSGTDSPDWKDPKIGFENKNVEEILKIKTETLPRDGKKYFGTEDPVSTDKMQKYLQLAQQETGVEPLSEEKAGRYLVRASSVAISKFLKKV